MKSRDFVHRYRLNTLLRWSRQFAGSSDGSDNEEVSTGW